jgi:hypothetical protein
MHKHAHGYAHHPGYRCFAGNLSRAFSYGPGSTHFCKASRTDITKRCKSRFDRKSSLQTPSPDRCG